MRPTIFCFFSFITTIGLLLPSFVLPPKDYWKILESVKLSAAVMTDTERLYLKPTFPPKIKRLEGKRIVLEGYLSFQQEYYILTPYLSSHGQQYSTLSHGPEETVEVSIIGDFTHKIQYVIIEGTLKLNYQNPTRPLFNLEKATCERCQTEKNKQVNY